MKPPRTPRDHALAFLAAYDTPHADAGDKHIVRIARTWLRIIKTKQPVQGIVDRILAEFEEADPREHGCGWDALRARFTEWAVAEEWIKPAGDVSPPGNLGPQ